MNNLAHIFTSLLLELEQLNASKDDCSIIYWASPVPYFGKLLESKVATLGINPSNIEFVSFEQKPLPESEERLRTLSSLNILGWEESTHKHLGEIIRGCDEYFETNPYMRWFSPLDQIIGEAGYSYQAGHKWASHLDMVPFATSEKWSELNRQSKSRLLTNSQMHLARMINASQIEVLICNGKSVIGEVEEISQILFTKEPQPAWNLPRKKRDVAGFSYEAKISSLGEHILDREVHVIGYNHNIQSSFGVTKAVKERIAAWVKSKLA